jgi:translation initiation factor IF-3
MANIQPNPKKRGYLLPTGCKDLIDVLKGKPPKLFLDFAKVNGKIQAKEVRVIGPDGNQLGIFPLADALRLARSHRLDLVQITSRARPPVCRLIDYGQFRYELSMRARKRIKKKA